MQAWSRSQGKLVEIPDEQAPTGGSSSGAPSIGNDPNVFKSIALMDLLKTGGKNLSKVQALQSISEQAKPPEPTADEKKQEAKITDVATTVQELEKNYNQIETKGALAGLLGLTQAKLTGGKVNTKIAGYESMRKSLIGPLARAISGEVGVLTDKDIARAEGLLPKVTDSAELASEKLNNLKELIRSKGGTDLGSSQPIAANKGLLEMVIPGSVAKGKEVTEQQQEFFNNPTLRGFLKTSYEASPISAITNPKSRQTAGEAATIVSLLTAGGAVKKGITGITEKGALANRAKAVESVSRQGTKFSAEQLYKKAEATALKNASETDLPKVRSLLETVKNGLQGSRTPEEAVQKLAAYNKSYSAAGKVGKTAKAVVDDALSKATREIFKDQAPEIAAAQSKLAQAMKLKKFGGSVGRQVLGTGIGVGAGSLLGWLIGRNQ